MVRNCKFSPSVLILPAKCVTAVYELKRATHKNAKFNSANIDQILLADKSNCILYNVVRCKQGCQNSP